MAKQQYTAREAARAIAQAERMIEAGHGMTHVCATLGVPELKIRRWWMKYGGATLLWRLA